MVKLDINGNTVANNRAYILNIIKNMPIKRFEIDSAGRVIIECGDGGSIRFFVEDERD